MAMSEPEVNIYNNGKIYVAPKSRYAFVGTISDPEIFSKLRSGLSEVCGLYFDTTKSRAG